MNKKKYRIKILCIAASVFLPMPALFSQITAPKAKYTMPVAYNTDTIIRNDTVYADIIYVKKNNIYINDLAGTSYPLVGDSVFTATKAYYVRANIFSYVPDTIYFITPLDTVFFSYYAYLHQHNIFVFIVSDAAVQNIGSLTATPPVGGSWQFTWSRYDTATHTYVVIKNDTADISTLDSLSDGGYRVYMTNGAIDTSCYYYAWVFNYYLYASLTKIKDSKGMLTTGFYCSIVYLDGEVKADTFIYYNIYNASKIILPNNINLSWSSDKNTNIFPPRNRDKLQPKTSTTDFDGVDLNENITYTLKVEDSFGEERSDKVIYDPIQTRAVIKIWYKDSKAERNNKDWEESENPKGSAPLRVLCKSESENSQRVEWFLGDSITAINFFGDSLRDVSEMEYDTFHIYFKPKKYTVKLISYSNKNCSDTAILFQKIEVEKSVLQMPNVFTPNGDGLNDFFRTEEDASIRRFYIQIYSAYGKKVYEYNGNLNDWKGWDGKIKDSNRDAAPGVYYYIVKAMGWELDPIIEYQGNDFAGYFYLYR